MQVIERRTVFILAALVLGCASAACTGQASQAALKIIKVDPPNWYAGFPKPLLLIRGEGLTGATFSVSDPAIKVERTAISENGHWAQVSLSATPNRAETIQLTIRCGAAQVDAPYTFAARRDATSGMAGFSSRDLIYLLMPDRFADGNLANDGPLATSTAASPEAAAERAKPLGWHGGDLAGIGQHVDYIQSIGATAVWPTPIYQNHAPEAYHGYHATDYYAVDEHFGTMADLQALAASLHNHHMKLILDIVPNHVGPFHPWVDDTPAPDWFHGTKSQHVQAEYNFNALVDQHAPERDRLATLHGWFVDLLPDMNTDSPIVSQYLRQNCIWWIEQTGADAFRIDTFSYVNREFWHDLTAQLRGLYPHLTEVGEISDGNPEITSAFADGVTRSGVDTGLYTPFDFPVYHATRDVFANGQPMSRLAQVLAADVLYPHPERLVPFLGNHDESRFAQSVTDPGLRGAAYAFLLTVRGTPQIYSGDEIAMTGGDDPDNRRDFPGGFSGDPQNAFDPAARSSEQSGLLNWIAQLAAVRQKYPALACGAQQTLFADQDSFVYARYGAGACPGVASGSQAIIVALHRGAATDVPVDLNHTAVTGCTAVPVLPVTTESKSTGNNGLALRLFAGAQILACM